MENPWVKVTPTTRSCRVWRCQQLNLEAPDLEIVLSEAYRRGYKFGFWHEETKEVFLELAPDHPQGLPQVYKPQEVARALKVGESTMLAWLRKGVVQGFRVGGTWRLTAEQAKACFRDKGGTDGRERHPMPDQDEDL